MLRLRHTMGRGWYESGGNSLERAEPPDSGKQGFLFCAFLCYIYYFFAFPERLWGSDGAVFF